MPRASAFPSASPPPRSRTRAARSIGGVESFRDLRLVDGIAPAGRATGFVLRHHRTQHGHAAIVRSAARGGRERQHGVAGRRERHRQGIVRPRRPSAFPPAREEVRRHQLWRVAGHAAGKRVVRLQGRRVHRRAQGQAGPLCAGRGRHAVSGRDWRHLARHADALVARLAGAGL